MKLLLLFLLPFGGALAARMLPRRWQAWVAWLVGSLITFFVIWLTGWLQPDQAALAVAGASVVGFLGPEIWHGTRQTIQTVLSQPRNWFYVAVIGTILYFFLHPELWEVTLILIFVLLGFRIMLLGIWPWRRR